jgi:hypothetical protein
MPINPLMRKPANTSGDYNTQAVGQAPIPEIVEGTNWAYRGSETHGVAPTVDPSPVEGISPTVDVPTEPFEPDPPPVPVRIVSEKSNAKKNFRIYRTIAPGGAAPKQLIGPMRNRSALKVKNADTVTIYIGTEQSTTTSAFGYPLAAGESIDMNDAPDAEIWGVSSDATDRAVAFLIAYETET